MKNEWTVGVDRAACIGSGMCVALAPERFTFDGLRSRPVSERVEPDERVREAAAACPVEAISLTMSDTCAPTSLG
jgi:ferredoxin